MPFILSIDQGTTSSRAVLYDGHATPVFTAQQEFAQHYPRDGWVEHDPEEIWQSVVACVKKALAFSAEQNQTVAALGITNQRETCIVWDKTTGAPIYNAIVWQDRRTAGFCEQLKADGVEGQITEKTGLLLDPYFSASKIAWILDNVEGARAKAKSGVLAYGTIDTFLMWKLSGGRLHATDMTNASRTSVFNIDTKSWDEDLLSLFDIPKAGLAEVLDCADDFGMTGVQSIGTQIPIFGVAGDQQAAAIGQGCLSPGDVKSTYGTGCFVLLNTGATRLHSKNRLLSTIGYSLNGQVHYALEGSIFIAGAAVQWLRDGLGVIKDAKETDALARSLTSNNGLYLVPAFTGLGAPYWDAQARGVLSGITRATGRVDLVRATLESVAYQSFDLLQAMKNDGARINALNIDGGMAANNWAAQFLADILNLPVVRPKNMETTALGAALLAGTKSGIYPDLARYAARHTPEAQFVPQMDEATRARNLAGWKAAIQKTLA